VAALFVAWSQKGEYCLWIIWLGDWKCKYGKCTYDRMKNASTKNARTNLQKWKIQVHYRFTNQNNCRFCLTLLTSFDKHWYFYCNSRKNIYTHVLAFSILIFSISAKCPVLYLHFPHLYFPVLAFSAPPIQHQYSWG